MTKLGVIAMTKLAVMALMIVAVVLAAAGPSQAGGPGVHVFVASGHPARFDGHPAGFVGRPVGFAGHRGFHPGFDGHRGFHHGHGRFFVGVTPFIVGPAYPYWWWSYPSPAYLYPPVYSTPAYVPPVYAAPPPAIWYYCASAGAYYPTVGSCAEPWVQVPAR